MATQSVLLDTSILIDYLPKGNKEKSYFFHLFDNCELYVSIISQFEVEIGLKSQQQQREYQEMIHNMTILAVDRSCLDQAVETYNFLKSRNQRIELADLLIAATALAHRLPVATLNAKHFARIPYLQLVDLATYQP